MRRAYLVRLLGMKAPVRRRLRRHHAHDLAPLACDARDREFDWDKLATVDRVRFALPRGQEAAFAWEHGHFKLSDMEFAKTKPKAGAHKKKRR